MTADGASEVDLAAIEAVRPAVERSAVRTPIFTSRRLTERFGAPVLLKAENLQRTGSFKIRGVAAKLAALARSGAAEAGIVVASAGNHAQAAAFGARQAGLSCEVFMPSGSSVGKAEATEAYGATVFLGGDSVDDCLRLATARAEATGRRLIHPFDDPAVVCGQGTLGLELAEQVDELATVVVPVGGGGLIAGVACALAALRPAVRVVGVQAAACAPFAAALASGSLPAEPALGGALATLADGIAVKQPGEITFPLVRRYVDEIVVVDEEEIAEAMVTLLEHSKLVVEGAGAVGAAAVLSGRVAAPASGSTVVLLSGGNVDTGLLTPVIRRHETNAGRRIVLFARISDRPGHLARLLTCIGRTGANLVTVEHLREGYDLDVRETAVHLVLETRNRDHGRAVIAAARAEGFAVEPVLRPPA